MTDALQKNKDNEVPLEKKLDDLYKLIDGIETAMMTTRRPDGSLVSRAMQTQRRTAGVDLWFMSNWNAEKLDEIALDPNVNVSYYRDRTREWVSVSGKAIISRDRNLVRGLYQPDWKAWLGDEGGERDGGPEDPRIALILVTAESVTYSKKDRPTPVVLFNIVKSMITGEPPKVADLREVSSEELRHAAKSREPNLRV
ncbi:MAG TPA: pyridoxamine 5'-phosphate oxidase family protein [Gemmatimonadaceae bacterium]|nr:pyridoxamine 5'-phosphate oxidase family protein [Gemmatimonadaceae bacterium]